MAVIVYALCALTALACAVILFRGYRRNPSLLLLLSTICFVGFAINNVILFVDLIIGPSYDLSPYRAPSALIGLAVLLYGLIWETVGS